MISYMIIAQLSFCIEASDNYRIDGSHKVATSQDIIVKQHVEDFKHLDEGFALLQAEGLYHLNFHDFLTIHSNLENESELSIEDFNQPGLGEVIQQAEDTIISAIQNSFLNILNVAIQNEISVDSIPDAKFNYAIRHHTGFMLPAIRCWINTQNDLGQTTLHRAAEHRHTEIAVILIAAQADLNVQNKQGKTPLHIAINSRNIPTSQLLIKSGANLNIKDSAGDTPLNLAARINYIKVTQMLLLYHADPNISDNAKNSPLHKAAQYKNIKIVKMLIEAQANLNQQNNSGDTPLHLASRRNAIGALMLLIEAQAEINIKNQCQETPLHNTIRYGNYIKAAQLLMSSQVIDINAENYHKDTPLHIAAQRNRIEISQLLIARKALLHVKNIKAQTPFQIAIGYGNNEIGSMLLVAHQSLN